MTVGTALSSLMALCGKSSVDTNLPVGMLAAAREAIRAASEEARIIAPSLFGRRQRVTLDGPAQVGFTLAQDRTAFYDVTGSIPGVGCTLLLEGATHHNTIAALGTVGTTGIQVAGGATLASLYGTAIAGTYMWVESLQAYRRTIGSVQLSSDGGNWKFEHLAHLGGDTWFNFNGGTDPSSGITGGAYMSSGPEATGDAPTVVSGAVTITGGALDRPAEGSAGPRSGMIWNDCWAPSNVAVRILADVTADGRPLSVLRGPEELAQHVEAQPFSQGYPIVPTTYDDGTNSTVAVPNQFPESARGGYRTPYQSDALVACWPDDFEPHGTRLRFAPMPGQPVLVELVTVNFPDCHNDNADLLLPAGLDSLGFTPLAQWHWMRSSWFKPESKQSGSIADEYSAAKRRLTNFRPTAGFIGRG